jgi:hypothetical protein
VNGKIIFLSILFVATLVGGFLLMDYLEDDKLYYIIAYVPVIAIAEFILLRSLFSDIFKEGDPGRPFETLKPIGAGESGEMRTVSLTASRFLLSNTKLELFVDDVKIADAKSGDRFRISLTTGAHKLTVKCTGAAVDETIPPGDRYDLYIYFNRSTKKSRNPLIAEDVTRGAEDAIARDTAGFRKFKRYMDIATIAGPIILCAVFILIFILPSS